MTMRAVVVGLGEVLWDILPNGRALGGAPANFAYMAKLLGDEGIVASRIGNDQLGREVLQAMHELGLSTAYIQHDDQHVTGTAQVTIDSDGQPTFTIKDPVAWDFLQWTDAWGKLSRQADVICFGSLVQRSPTSAATIDSFLQSAEGRVLRICDVNLRQSYYSADVLTRSFQRSDIVKLNDQELSKVASVLGIQNGDDKELAERLLKKFNFKLVCITRGAFGSLLVSNDQKVEHTGFKVKVLDTVGAGDAFTACLAHHYLRGRSLEEISESANRFASWLTTQVGATPRADHLHLRGRVTADAIEVTERSAPKPDEADR
jgi:fructokinase